MRTRPPMKGVNLGNWLVLEKWMSPELFDGTSAEDETSLCRALSKTAKRERLKVHRDTFITSRDFAYLAARGIDFVRIPVPFFIFGDYEPYIGCIDYLDKAFAWGEQTGIQILIDLHTVPDSQNGFDNGGVRGVCKFHQHPAHVAFALGVLERLAARYHNRPNLWGIEVLNEPISQDLWTLLDWPNRFPAADSAYANGSEPVPTAFLKRFYQDAYARIRSQAGDIRIVFHDGFRVHEWVGFFTEAAFRNIVVDTHMYLVDRFLADGDADLDTICAYVETNFGGTLKAMSEHFPIMVGEWCLDPYSPKVYALTGDDRRTAYQRLAAAQLNAFQHATAWSYWAYRLHADEPRWQSWDLLQALEQGYMPSLQIAPRRPARAQH